jgi:Cdc6-like AAA superfamily ATPase
MEKNYEELYQSLLTNIENLNPLICLLYGFTGNGRKTCIRWCVNKIQSQFDPEDVNLRTFFINGTIQTTELQIIQKIQGELGDDETKQSYRDMEKDPYQKLDQIFTEQKITPILVIEQIENFAKTKR